ncbi:MAG: fibronectin type III domain-containing protein [Bacteroidales bacterium]|nr:fibronectin type III domain-containing protein [Bacteroidales bacterium]
MIKNINNITIATAFIGILLTTIAFNACEDREYNNPYDQKVEIDTLSPYDLEVEHVSIVEKKLTWKCDAEKVEQFIIDKKVGDANWQEAFAEVAGDSYEWTDTEIELGKSHQYKVKAKFDEKTTAASSLIDFDANIPSPTDLQTEEISDVSYKLLWKDNSNGEQGFRIDRKRNNQDWEIDYGKVQANQTQFVDTNVLASRENNINVEYRVYAFYEQYESEKISTNTNAALTAPTNGQIISNSISSVTLSWQDNSEGEQGFRIERKYEGGTWNEINETQSNSFEDDDFELNTQVYYRVSCYYNQYSSSYLESDFDATIPAPENFEITQNSMTSVTLNWSYPYTGHDYFQIDRKVDNGSWETQYQTVDATTTSLTDEVALENHDYTYRVIAILEQYLSNYAIQIIYKFPYEGLISYYTFDGDATDAHGNNNGTVNGATQTSSGKINQAYSFDGSNDFIQTSLSGKAKSFAFWFKPSKDYTASTGSQRGFIDFNTGNSEYCWIGTRWSGDSEIITLHTGSNQSGGWSTSALDLSTFSSGIWYHIAFVWNGSTYYLYLNGINRSSPDESNPFTNLISSEIDIGTMKIGTSNTDFFYGSMDEVAIYSRALSSSEISQLFNSGDGLQYPN